MAIAVAVWSIALKPGKKETIVPLSDLRITNVALGDELKDSSGRTTVKFTHGAPVQSDPDGDDGNASPEALSTTVLCSLTPSKIEQTMVDLILEEDAEFVFEVVGKNTVYLTGNYIDQSPVDNVPFNDSDDSDDAYDLRDVSSDVEVDINDLADMGDDDRFEEVLEEAEAPKLLKRPRESDAMETEEPSSAKLSKAERKRLNKKLRAEGGQAIAVDESTSASKTNTDEKQHKKKGKDNEAEKKEKLGGEERELGGGLKIKDVKVGSGPQAKRGNTVSMRYIGRLQDGSVFDKNTTGKPFTFHLGKGEVIKGWDQGIVGMQPGGERLLIVPPEMGYGKKKTSGIPANSILKFECKLVEIK